MLKGILIFFFCFFKIDVTFKITIMTIEFLSNDDFKSHMNFETTTFINITIIIEKVPLLVFFRNMIPILL